VVLGMRAVKHLCLIASTYPWMSRPLAGYGLGPKDLFRHSFGVGVAAQMLASDAGLEPDQAFASGLLHDIGKVALNVWMEARLPALMVAATQRSLTLEQAEREFFGFDHTEVGGLMAEQWNLPKPMVRAIRYHHDPGACEANCNLVHCVHLADELCSRANIAPNLDGLPHYVNNSSLEKWELDTKGFDELVEPFLARYEAQQKLFESYEG
jgi:putative nucleotidyltransferase with HDIG domain